MRERQDTLLPPYASMALLRAEATGAGRYRAQLLLQTSNRSELQQLLKDWDPQLEALKQAPRVRWSIDVDPVDLL